MKDITKFLLAAAMLAAPAAAMAMPAAAPQAHHAIAKRGQARMMHEIFKHISAGNYEKAAQLQQELDKDIAKSRNRAACKEALYPLYDLAKALVKGRPATASAPVERDVWQAFNDVRDIYVRDTGIEQANVFLAHEDIMLSVDLIHSMIEKQLIAYTQAQNTAEAYERLVSVLAPSNPAYRDAQRQLARLEFNRLCTSAAGCRNYMRLFPESPLIDQAKERTQKFDFQEAQRQNTLAGWQKFIEDYRLVKNANDYVNRAKAELRQLEEAQLANANATLKALDDYASSHKRDLDNRVFRLYDNLINLPTHSYRYLSIKLGFNGVTGRVEEVVKEATGKAFTNYFVFNDQGLLTEEYNGRYQQLTRYTYGFDKTKGFYPLTKTVGQDTYRYTCSYHSTTGRIAKITCDDGTTIKYRFDERGHIASHTETNAQGKTRQATYKSGKIRTEQTGSVLLLFNKYDSSRVTEIDSKNGQTVNKWTYDYLLDSQHRWTTARAKLNGTLRVTITRHYPSD